MLSKKVQLFPSLGLSLLLVILLTALLIVPPFVLADAPANQEQTDRLVVEQAKVADQYERFKKNITDLADFLRQTDPERAEVLEKAVEQMNRGDAVEHFTEVVELLGQDAILISDVDEILSSQNALETELQSLLALLLTENRQSQSQSEKQKITRYLKEIGRIIRLQKAVQAETERVGRVKDLVPQQQKLEKQAQSLAEKMQADTPSTKKSAAKKTEKSSEQSKEESPQPGEKQPGEKQSGEKQSGEKEEGEADSQSRESSPQQAIERARKQMRAAIENLKQAEKERAQEKQYAAIAALEKAKAELARILRQLREEEIERVLALLEARFQKILRLQTRVYEETLTLDQTKEKARDRSFEIEASRLSEKQSKIVGLVDATLVLFRNEGSAVALPEASLQLREDMELVMVRLDRAETGTLTQQIIEDILESLKEIIGAIEQSQQDQEQRKKQEASGQGQAANSDPPLVDMLAELKMIRSLQWRVNRRTARYQEVVLTGRSSRESLLPELKKLSDRQSRIEKIARDIVLENNR